MQAADHGDPPDAAEDEEPVEAAGAEGAQAADVDDDMTLVRFSALQRMRHALRRRTLAEATFKQKPVLALPAPPTPAAGPPADQAGDDAAGVVPPAPPTTHRPLRGPRAHVLPASGYHGVVKKSHFCWQAKTSFESKNVFIGSFSTPEAAARAYDTCVRGLQAVRSSGIETKLNFLTDDIAAAAVAEAELQMGERLRMMQTSSAYKKPNARENGGAAAEGGGGEGEEVEGDAGGEGGEEGTTRAIVVASTMDVDMQGLLTYGASTGFRKSFAPNMKLCPHCGSQLMSRQKLCRMCRAPVASQVQVDAAAAASGGAGDGAAGGQLVIAAAASQLKGVRPKKCAEEIKYQSFLWRAGKNNYLGTFHTPEEAGAEYDAKYREACAQDGVQPDPNKLNWATPEAAMQAVNHAKAAIGDRKKISTRTPRDKTKIQAVLVDGAHGGHTSQPAHKRPSSAAPKTGTKKRTLREVDVFTPDAPPLLAWVDGTDVGVQHALASPVAAAQEAQHTAGGAGAEPVSVFDALGL